MTHEVERSVSGPGEPSIARELEAIPYEPLLPIEKKLIVSCLLLGILLLGLLLWASATFFPVAGPERAPLGNTNPARQLSRRVCVYHAVGTPRSLARSSS